MYAGFCLHLTKVLAVSKNVSVDGRRAVLQIGEAANRPKGLAFRRPNIPLETPSHTAKLHT